MVMHCMETNKYNYVYSIFRGYFTLVMILKDSWQKEKEIILDSKFRYVCKEKEFVFYGAIADVQEKLIYVQVQRVDKQDCGIVQLVFKVSNPQTALRVLGIILASQEEGQKVNIIKELESRALQVDLVDGILEEIDREENYKLEYAKVIERKSIQNAIVTSRLGVAVGVEVLYVSLADMGTAIFITTSLGVLELKDVEASDTLYYQLCEMIDNAVANKEVVRV